MRGLLLGISALCLAALPRPGLAEALPDTLERLRGSVVGVGTSYPPRQPIGGKRPNQLLGTGFVIGDGRLVATNAHVLPDRLDSEHRQSVAVFTGRGRAAVARPARVLGRDDVHDVAIVSFEGATMPALTLAPDIPVREGQMTAFTGFPIGAVLGLYPATHRGIVSAIAPIARPANQSRELSPAQLLRMRDPFEVYQLDAIAYPGNSGSPVYLPATGEVIGVVNSVFVKESAEAVLERPSGISYAIPVRHLTRLLAQISEDRQD